MKSSLELRMNEEEQQRRHYRLCSNKNQILWPTIFVSKLKVKKSANIHKFCLQEIHECVKVLSNGKG